VHALKEERLANFLYDNKDPARHILSFFGMKWGKKDLRNASHQRLLELGLQKKVLREGLNELGGNQHFWGVQVDGDGELIDEE